MSNNIKYSRPRTFTDIGAYTTVIYTIYKVAKPLHRQMTSRGFLRFKLLSYQSMWNTSGKGMETGELSAFTSMMSAM